MRLRGGVLGAFGALLVITFASTHHFGAGAAQGTTRCGTLQLPVVAHPTATLILTPASGGQSLAFEAHVSSIEANMTQTNQPADLIWDQGVANLEQVLTFGTYANGDNFISINGQVPPDAAPGQHPVRVCWLYSNQTWYYVDGSFDVTASTPAPTPTPTATLTPTPTSTATVTPTPTATPAGQTPTPSPPEATPIFIPMMLGDPDCSGSVTIGDALLPLRFAIGLKGFGDCISSADVNDDHKIDAVDGLDILKDVAGLYTGLAIGTRPTPKPPQYSVVVVAEGGSYDGFAHANRVNSWGEVVGETGKHAFFWDPSGSPKLSDLGTLGGLHSAAYGINYDHEVVGSAQISSGITRAFHWDSTAGMTNMGGYDGHGYVARDINSKGTAVGYYGLSSLDHRAFIWDQAGGIRGLGSGGSNAEALAINDWGVAVGGGHGWHDDGTEFTISGPLGCCAGVDARGISLGNQVVGTSSMLGDDGYTVVHRAFRWNESKGMIDLGSLTSDCTYNECSGANDINLWDQAVGWSDDYQTAVLWNKGKIEDLNNLIAAGTEWKLTVAKAINDQGLIACDGTIRPGSSDRHTGAFLLLPVVVKSLVIEPASATGGTTFTGRITLSGAAPIPIEVSLKTTSLAAYTSFPTSVTIPRGATEATFSIDTSVVSTVHTGHLTASFGGWKVDGPMAINP